MAPARPGVGAVPSYDTFRKYASFSTDIGDFGMTQAQFRKFLADVGVGGLGGMLTGDTSILFAKHATKGCMNYDGACASSLTIYKRMKEQHLMNCNNISPKTGRITSVTTAITNSSDKGVNLPGAVPSVEDQASPAFQAPHRKKMIRASETDHDPPVVHTPEIIQSIKGREELKQIRQQYFPEEMTEWASLQQRHNQYASVKLMLEEPNLIREVIPPPKTPTLRVQTAVASVQAAISQGDFFLAKTAIGEVERMWVAEAYAGGSDDKSAGKAAPVSAADRVKSPPKKTASGRLIDTARLIPKEGWAYIHLMSVSVAVSRGNLSQAAEMMSKAWRSIHGMELYEEHIYNLLGQYMNAMLEFFMHHYAESATMFQDCIDMISPIHGQEWKSTGAAAWNNIGVCHQMTGDRGKSLRCYEEATKTLTSIGCDSADNRYLAVKKNKARLLRSAAMPKAQTPHMPVDIEYEAQKEKQKSVLLGFLKTAVPTRLQSVGVPEKKKKKKKSKKKGKEDEKKSKKKDAAPKKKKLGVILMPPRYALQGIGALAPKKKGKGKKKK